MYTLLGATIIFIDLSDLLIDGAGIRPGLAEPLNHPFRRERQARERRVDVISR